MGLISAVLVENEAATFFEGCAGSSVPWWSFTKVVLAAASLVLVRDGTLKLDEQLEGRPFTLRQLLRHEAGLTDYGSVPEYHAAVARREEPWPEEEMLERAQASRLRYEPGKGWGYSNIGYLYVRHLIQNTTRDNLDSALRRLVLGPLGITHTKIASEQEHLRHLQMGGAGGYDPRWVYHGLLVGPLEEAALLLHRLMNDQLLPASLLEAMKQSRPLGHIDPGRPWKNPGYGLGLMIGTNAGQVLAGHTGAGPGSVIAVYHATAATPRTSASFAEGNDQGEVENEVARRLSQH